MLGQWQEAYQDLCKAQNIDFDDNIAETLPEIKANANKIKVNLIIWIGGFILTMSSIIRSTRENMKF